MELKSTPDSNILISVIITCFNLEKHIGRAINSCINQTLSDDRYEIIVVDDCSTDGSWEVISQFSGLVNSSRLEKNSGVSAASNKGITLSSGKYIVRVDGDDFINKNFLFTLSEILEWNDDIGFVYCDHIVVNEKFERKQSLNTLDMLLDHGAGIMFRKRYLESIGLYDESLRNREDYDLILRYIKNFNGYHLRLPYYRYFKRSGSLSSKTKERESLKKKIDEDQNVTS
jgi:glycosyltransferase involved in cell wall biosynthesis